MIAAIQRKPVATGNTDSANANPARTKPPAAFSNALSVAVNKSTANDGVHGLSKLFHDRKAHAQPTASNPMAGSLVLPDAVAVVLAPVPLPNSLPPMLPTSLTPAASAPEMAAALMKPGDGTVLQAAEPSVASGVAVTPTTKNLTGSSNGVSTLPVGCVTNDHEAALREAVAAVVQRGSKQSVSASVIAAKDIVPAAKDLVSAGAATVTLSAQVGTIAASGAQVTPGVATSVSQVQGLRSATMVRVASPLGAAKAPEGAASGDYRKASAVEASSEADASSAGSDGGQSKADETPQVLDATALQVSVALHGGTSEVPTTVASLPQVAASGTPTTLAHAGAAEVAASVHVAAAETVATPLVNSARLIQSIQQSDMRVGINSSEFGNISIHTSSLRGQISSEITLAHEELAKVIGAHVSAVLEKPGAVQSLNVRIETNSFAGGSSQGPSQGAQHSKQQRDEGGRSTTSRSTGSQPWAEQTPSVAARSQGLLSGRLDIRV